MSSVSSAYASPPSVSPSVESAYAKPPYSDSCGDLGDFGGKGDLGVTGDLGDNGERGEGSGLSGSLRSVLRTGCSFLNFSKKGSDGVEGGSGKGAFGGSSAGGITRSRLIKLRSERADGEGVRAIVGWVGVVLVRPSRGEAGLPAETGECCE